MHAYRVGIMHACMHHHRYHACMHHAGHMKTRIDGGFSTLNDILYLPLLKIELLQWSLWARRSYHYCREFTPKDQDQAQKRNIENGPDPTFFPIWHINIVHRRTHSFYINPGSGLKFFKNNQIRQESRK